MPAKLSKGLFVAASVVMILTGVAHTIATLTEEPPKTDLLRQLTDLMRTAPIELPGAHRTMRELFQGFGWHFSISLAAIAVIGLIVSRGSFRVRRTYAGAAAVFLAILTVNSVLFFFAIPTAFMGLSALLYAAAFLTSPKAEPEIQA